VHNPFHQFLQDCVYQKLSEISSFLTKLFKKLYRGIFIEPQFILKCPLRLEAFSSLHQPIAAANAASSVIWHNILWKWLNLKWARFGKLNSYGQTLDSISWVPYPPQWGAWHIVLPHYFNRLTLISLVFLWLCGGRTLWSIQLCGPLYLHCCFLHCSTLVMEGTDWKSVCHCWSVATGVPKTAENTLSSLIFYV